MSQACHRNQEIALGQSTFCTGDVQLVDKSPGTKVKVKSATLVAGDPKDPFLIATTLRCRRGYYFILWIAPLYP